MRQTLSLRLLAGWQVALRGHRRQSRRKNKVQVGSTVSWNCEKEARTSASGHSFCQWTPCDLFGASSISISRISGRTRGRQRWRLSLTALIKSSQLAVMIIHISGTGRHDSANCQSWAAATTCMQLPLLEVETRRGEQTRQKELPNELALPRAPV